MMHLIGLALALALLWAWLSGHWFARIVAFLTLAVALGFSAGVWLDHPGYGDAAARLGLLAGIILAWPVSSIPVYHRRHVLRSQV